MLGKFGGRVSFIGGNSFFGVVGYCLRGSLCGVCVGGFFYEESIFKLRESFRKVVKELWVYRFFFNNVFL